MLTQETIDYNRIAEAIDYIRNNFRQQPDLDAVAKQIHLSPSHFQRLFTEWAGTSPKKFLQYITVEHAKNILKENKQVTLLDTSFETGLSSTSRLHDLFINIEGMTPAEYRNNGKDLVIHYSFAKTPFGKVIVASTSKGICYMAFEDDKAVALNDLINKFPEARFIRKPNLMHQNALFIFHHDWRRPQEIKMHLKGSPFQLKVWQCLLKIPMGKFSTYSTIARQIGTPGASRAVGTAIGNNPIAFLIPCHRVIRSTGEMGGYMWGATRKAAMIGWEGARTA